VMLVLDKSGSINTSGQTETVKKATRAFLNALSGTGAAVSIVDFSSTAARPVKYTTVTGQVNSDGTNATGSIGSTFEPYLKNEYKPSGYTNWEAAFHEVYEANGLGTRADLVVFITDGDPTAYSGPPGNPTIGLTEGDIVALGNAQAEADNVKRQKSHVFALGVGAAVTTEASAARLTAISGFDEYTVPPAPPGAPFSKADYTLVQNFDKLAKALQEIAVELCQSSLTVTKEVDEGDGKYRVDSGWDFTATVSTSPGGFTWLQPETGGGASRTATTDDEGVATFQWKPSNSTATSKITLTEEQKPGYEFVDVDCVKNAPGRTGLRRTQRTTTQVTVPDVGPKEYVRCTVRNRIKPGTIEIEKNATPESSQGFDFTGSLGSFTLIDDNKDTNASKIFENVTPGTYTVSEIVPEKWELSGITCTPEAAAAIQGPQATITLAPGGSVVCTYNDLRFDPPLPPEPPSPPGPPTTPTTPGSPPEPDALAPPSTVLKVDKKAARTARVGQRIAFELTVTNIGSVPARNVIVADVPPATLGFAGLQSTGGGRAQVRRGNAYWRLGPLAVGASRTVRGSALIEAGNAGIHRNLVQATAVNANLARDHTDTRVLAQRRVIPPVTG